MAVIGRQLQLGKDLRGFGNGTDIDRRRQAGAVGAVLAMDQDRFSVVRMISASSSLLSTETISAEPNG